jgi:hypothetical protein
MPAPVDTRDDHKRPDQALGLARTRTESGRLDQRAWPAEFESCAQPLPKCVALGHRREPLWRPNARCKRRRNKDEA